MAAADLASLLIHPWVFLIYDFFQNYQLGEIGCKLEGAIECNFTSNNNFLLKRRK